MGVYVIRLYIRNLLGHFRRKITSYADDEAMRRFRNRRSSVMEVSLVLTHLHWWDKANTPYMEYVVYRPPEGGRLYDMKVVSGYAFLRTYYV